MMAAVLPGFLDVGMRVLSTGGIVTLVGLWWRRDIALRKIASSEAGDLRDDYAVELAAVRNERHKDRLDFLEIERHLRDLIRSSDARHAECEEARQEMRLEMNRMHDEIAGLKSQLRMVSTDRVVELGPGEGPSAPHARAAATRMKDRLEGGDK
jgi:hypothetical protein